MNGHVGLQLDHVIVRFGARSLRKMRAKVHNTERLLKACRYRALDPLCDEPSRRVRDGEALGLMCVREEGHE